MDLGSSLVSSSEHETRGLTEGETSGITKKMKHVD